MIRSTSRFLDPLRSALRTTTSILSDKIGLLDGIKKDDYTRACPIVGASVGQHVRHSLHHITLATQPLLEVRGAETVLDYDERVRGDVIETDKVRGGERDQKVRRAKQVGRVMCRVLCAV